MATIVTRSGKGSPLTNTEVDSNFTNLNTDKAELSGAAFTGAITTNSTIDGRDVAADGVTADAALPKSGGAMTGAITTNSTFDGVDIATRDAVLTSTTTTANAALPKAGGAMTGAITTNSTFDGRDVATDGTKLDGIEASADVTDTANVTAAGALMDSELTAIASVKALNQGVATGDSPDFAALNVNGTATMDGLVVGGSATVTGDTIKIDSATHAFYKADRGDSSSYAINRYYTAGTESWRVGLLNDGTSNFHIYDVAGSGDRLSIGTNGDISFYEDTGTTPKLFWDASAERLGIGTSSPQDEIHIEANYPQIRIASGLNTIGSNNLTSTVDGYGTDGIAWRVGRAFGSGDLQIVNHRASATTFDNGGTEAMRIDSSGNVGIGTDSPSGYRLNVSKGATGNIAQLTDGVANTFIIRSDSNTLYAGNANNYPVAFVTNNVERMTIDSSGNIGIGESNPQELLHLTATTPVLRMEGASRAYQQYVSGTSFTIRDVTAGLNRVTLDSSGNLLVGKSNTTFGTVGVENRGNGRITSTRSGNTNLLLNRLSSDGSLIDFYKNGAQIGIIGTYGGTCYMGGSGTLGGLMFNGSIEPTRGQTRTDAAHDLGSTAYRFKDLYIAGLNVTASTYNKISSYFSGSYTSGFKFSDMNGGIWYDAASDDLTVSASHANSQLILESGGSASMTLDASGHVHINSSSLTPQFTPRLFVAQTGVEVFLELKTSSTTGFGAVKFRNGNGDVGSISMLSGSVSYNTSSDYRLKENVVPMTGSIDRVKALKPSQFNFITDADKTVDGFLAHEAQEIVPECVTGTKDAMRDEEYEVTAAIEEVRDEDDNITTEAVEAVMGTRSVPDMQGIDQSKLVPLLTAALQEAITKIESLTDRIAALEE